METTDKRICDRCSHFEVTPGGCREICHAMKIGSALIAHMPKPYVEDRMNGNKNNCKEFKKL